MTIWVTYLIEIIEIVFRIYRICLLLFVILKYSSLSDDVVNEFLKV